MTEGIINDFAARERQRAADDHRQEILERCIYPMINEGAKILDEGKAIRASDIDVVWINGYGWPVYRGGPMFYADQIGLDKVARPAAGAGGERRSAVDAGTAARTSRR